MKLEGQFRGKCASCKVWSGLRVCTKTGKRKGSGDSCPELDEIPNIVWLS